MNRYAAGRCGSEANRPSSMESGVLRRAVPAQLECQQ